MKFVIALVTFTGAVEEVRRDKVEAKSVSHGDD